MANQKDTVLRSLHDTGLAAWFGGSLIRGGAKKGVGQMSGPKPALGVAPPGATAYSRMLGKKMEKAQGTPVEGTTEPDRTTPEDVAAAQRQQRVAQWAVPVFT